MSDYRRGFDLLNTYTHNSETDGPGLLQTAEGYFPTGQYMFQGWNYSLSSIGVFSRERVFGGPYVSFSLQLTLALSPCLIKHHAMNT
jgi:hypothetical protein